MAIKITKNDLLKLSEKNIISKETATEIWNNLAHDLNQSKFNFVNVLYFLGALITISAMTWFATEAFSKLHGIGLLITSICYFFIFFFSGNYFIKKENTYIPGGLLLTLAVFMTPLIVFSIQDITQIWIFKVPGEYNDFFKWIRSGWFFIEIVTISVSIVFISIFQFTFLTFPLAFSLWFLSMDVVPIIFGTDFSWDERRIISIIFGLIILLISYLLDKKTKKDYSFWLYLFGLLAFWGGISTGFTNEIAMKILYCCINLLLIFISVAFQRKVFVVFGAVGIFIFLSDLAYNIFRDSLLFPFFLSLVGIGFIVLGILYVKNKNKIDEYIVKNMPDFIKKIVPK